MLKPPSVPVAVVVAVLLAASLPVGAGPGGRLEGFVLAEDGRAASGFTMHLVDDAGREVGRSTTTDEGVYRFEDLPSGRYSLAVEDAQGRLAPVAAPPVQLGGQSLARRDVRVMPVDPAGRQAALDANPSMGLWWAGLSPAARVWTVVGVVVFVLLTISALDNGDDVNREQPASPMDPS